MGCMMAAAVCHASAVVPVQSCSHAVMQPCSDASAVVCGMFRLKVSVRHWSCSHQAPAHLRVVAQCRLNCACSKPLHVTLRLSPVVKSIRCRDNGRAFPAVPPINSSTIHDAISTRLLYRQRLDPKPQPVHFLHLACGIGAYLWW
jgi:hypothetical protein